MEWGARLHSEAMPCSRPRVGLHEMPLMRAAAGFGASRWVRLDRPCPAPPPSQACARPTSRLARLPAAEAAIHCDCVVSPPGPGPPPLHLHLSLSRRVCEFDAPACLFIPFVTANRFSTVP